METPDGLSRRERQVMEILFRKGRATAVEVLEELPDPPTNATVRTILRVLERKGHVKHQYDGPRFVYEPRVTRDRAKRSAVRSLLSTFFEDSLENAMVTLLDVSAAKLSEDEFARVEELIRAARKRSQK